MLTPYQILHKLHLLLRTEHYVDKRSGSKTLFDYRGSTELLGVTEIAGHYS